MHHNILKGLIKVGKKFTGAYHLKSEKFKEHIILVVEEINDSDDNKIIGACSISVTNKHFGGVKKKTGFLYNMRIHSDYQG